MEREKENEQASWDDVRSELQDLIKNLKSAEEERMEAMSRLSERMAKTQRELEEIDKDPERKAAFERMLKTTPVSGLISKQNPED